MRRFFNRLSFLLLAFLAAESTPAQTSLPPLFGDHMVLQRGMPIPIWGKDLPGRAVTVNLAGRSAAVTAGPDGKWKALLPVMKTGGPFELVAEGSGSVTLKDVCVGEVWLASGQSNMVLGLSFTKDAAQETAKADFPLIRWFVQAPVPSDHPGEEPQGQWQVCSSATAGGFSAAAYYFAKKIHHDLKVPVGILGSYYSGTRIESWISRDTFESDPSFKPLYAGWNSTPILGNGAQPVTQPMQLALWGLRLTSKDPAHKPLTLLPSSAGNWACDFQPGSALSFEVKPDGGPGPGPVGFLTAILQAGSWGNCGTFLAPGGAAADLGAYDTLEFEAKGKGLFNAGFSQPIVEDGDEYACEPFAAAPDWKTYQIAFSSLRQSGKGKPRPFQGAALTRLFFNACVACAYSTPAALYNGMVSPLVPYGIRGILWYQGEFNTDEPQMYRRLLPALIRGWRADWGGGELPFVIAQLANFHWPNTQGGNGWPELREAQASALELPHTGMAVLIDVGDRNDIHPKDKADVGYRLALSALHVAYGRKGPYSGPVFERLRAKGPRVWMRFRHCDGGLKAKGKKVRGFELEGEDGVYLPAEAQIAGKNQVVVWSPLAAHPKGVRYAWSDDPVCDLYNGADLPAQPFRAEVKP